MPRTILVIVGLSVLLGGCMTLEERLAARVGCNAKKLKLHFQMNVPAYSQYEFVCEGRKHTCRDAPFVSTCGDGWHRDQKGKENQKKTKK